jgi:hypothetical protein
VKREREGALLNVFKKITCRLAIQVCIGYSPSGTARHRTFSIKGIHPTADFSKLAAFVCDCVAPVLAYPITKVTLVKKIPVVLGEPEDTTEATPAPAMKPCRAQTASRAAFRLLFERAIQFVKRGWKRLASSSYLLIFYKISEYNRPT